MEYQETEMNEGMIKRNEEIEQAVYDLLLLLLQIEPGQADKEFPRDMKVIRQVLGLAVEVLGGYGKEVCIPYLVTSGERIYRCTLTECGCEKCHYQEDFMIKERMLSCIDKALEGNGYQILKGDHNSVIVRDKKAKNDFHISIVEISE